MRRIREEVQEKDSRTPLLLPLENFGSKHVRESVQGLPYSIGIQDRGSIDADFESYVGKLQMSARLEAGARRTSFTDERGLRFETLQKAGSRHGGLISAKTPHNAVCFLKGHLRLGVPFHSAFHYDVTGRDGARVHKEMPDCHGHMEMRTGNPHVNIYPNDFIR